AAEYWARAAGAASAAGGAAAARGSGSVGPTPSLVPGPRSRLVVEREAAGPVDLLTCGEGELQEPEGLELVRAAQGAGVDRGDAARSDRGDEGRLGVGVVTRDEHGGRGLAGFAGGESGC